ncbi:MAG: nitrilase-related carbon-nitrogen hydrolase [Thermodesulfovibrionales bacterium]
MRIGLIELNTKWESKGSNYERVSSLIGLAASKGCDAVVLPEMFNTGFSMNIDRIGEEIEGSANIFLSEVSEKFRINIIAGYPVKDAGDKKGRNIAAVYNRKGLRIAEYAKVHLFKPLKEHLFYGAGTDTVIFNIDGIASSVFICFDLRFPELFRKVAKDVQMIFVLANWPSSREDHWITLLKARAIENQCFVIGVNRKGIDGNNIHYSGCSRIFSPVGEEIRLKHEDDELLIGDIEPGEVITTRSKYPFLEGTIFF